MNHFWLGLLILMWRTFQSVEGAKGKCPSPLAVDFAEFFAESYLVGTQVTYKCDEGYTRPSGQIRIIKCNADKNGFGQWTSVQCIVDPTLSLRPSTQPATQFEEESGMTDGPRPPAPPPIKGFCGVLKPSKHVKVGSMTYTVGQVLHYRCMDGYQARNPISDRSMCQNSKGSIFWSRLRLQCTNDTMPIGEDITPETGPSDVPSGEAVTCPKIVTEENSNWTNFAAAIYPSSAVFAIAMMATVAI